MHIPITFKDFGSKEAFLSLQNKFIIQDERENPYEPIVITKVFNNDFTIIIKDLNPITYKEEFQEKSFYDDFLFNAVDNLSKRYLNFIDRQFENAIFLDKEKRFLFARNEQAKLNSLIEVIRTASYLEKKIKDIVEVQIDIVLEHLTNIHIHENCNLEKKLKFKLGKGVVLVLFSMLREMKYIDSPYNADFGKFINDNFLWWDDSEKIYKPFKSSNKVISDYINSNKSLESPLKKIKELLTDKAFYDFPYR